MLSSNTMSQSSVIGRETGDVEAKRPGANCFWEVLFLYDRMDSMEA